MFRLDALHEMPHQPVCQSIFHFLLWPYTKNRGVHRLLPMDFRLREPGIVEQSFQLLWRIGCHSLHEVRPLGIGIDYFDHPEIR